MRMMPIVMTPLLLTLALRAADGPAATEAARQVIEVKTAAELVAAIGSNRIIRMAPGDYDLSELEHKTTRHVRFGLGAIGADDSLVIRHVENLTIECTGAKPARITTPDASIYILNFDDATHVVLRNLEMVHEVQGECTGGVLYLSDVHDMTMDRVTLSGCGTEGLTMAEVDHLTFKNSTITSCSQDILSATELTESHFIDSQFKGNVVTGYGMTFAHSPGVVFEKCTIADNKTANGDDAPDAFVVTEDDECKILFTDCTIKGNAGTEFSSGDGVVRAKGGKAEDNGFTLDHDEKDEKREPAKP